LNRVLQIESMKTFLLLSSLLLLASCTSQSPKFESLEYKAGACFGFCPIFKLTIHPDRTALIEAERFTFTNPQSKDYDPKAAPEGTFKTKIKEASFNELLKTLNAANLSTLKSYYGNKNVTDLPTAKLKLVTSPTQSVEIEDYGKRGTPELRALYEALEGLRTSETWVKVD